MSTIGRTPSDFRSFPWDVVPKSHFVRIVADEVSGRRFRAVYAGPGGQHPKRTRRDLIATA